MASNVRLWDLFIVKNAKWHNFYHNSSAWRVEWLGKNDESTWVHKYSNTDNSLHKRVMKRFALFVVVLTFFFDHWWWQTWTWTIFSPLCTSSKMNWTKFGYKLLLFFFFEEFGYKSGYKQWLQLYSISF